MSTSDEIFLVEEFCQKYPLLLAHLDEVLEKDKKTNLTGIKDREAGKVFHILDSLAVLQELNSAPKGELVDLGSGAGYPGIPLAIVSGRKTTLIESNNKKAQFLSDFVNEHALGEQITVVSQRSELLEQKHRENYAVLTMRAVASLPSILELAAPLLMPGGHFIALKGNLSEEEFERGEKASSLLGMKLLEKRKYEISEEHSKRCVLTYERLAERGPIVPRRPGMATKRPLA